MDCGAGGEGDSSCAHGILDGDRNDQLYGTGTDSDVTWLIRPPLTEDCSIKMQSPTQEGKEKGTSTRLVPLLYNLIDGDVGGIDGDGGDFLEVETEAE